MAQRKASCFLHLSRGQVGQRWEGEWSLDPPEHRRKEDIRLQRKMLILRLWKVSYFKIFIFSYLLMRRGDQSITLDTCHARYRTWDFMLASPTIYPLCHLLGSSERFLKFISSIYNLRFLRTRATSYVLTSFFCRLTQTAQLFIRTTTITTKWMSKVWIVKAECLVVPARPPNRKLN